MTRVAELLQIKWPIIQAGMVWVAGGKLAGASAQAGILGVIGAGSMSPDLLRQHIRKAITINGSSAERLAVNIPLLYKYSKQQAEVALEEGVRIIITSAGSPRLLTSLLKQNGCTVLHVVSSPLLAKKCEAAGVDLIIAEGFEAGGHNGRDEITTMALVPQVVDATRLPVIAAGGIADSRGIVAAMALGAEGVQLGTRFVATQESSAHSNFVSNVVAAGHDATMLCLKPLVPVRMMRNVFYQRVSQIEQAKGSKEDLESLLGHGRARAGMLDGDLEEGELEIGQICALVEDVPTVSQLVKRLVAGVVSVWTKTESQLGSYGEFSKSQSS